MIAEGAFLIIAPEEFQVTAEHEAEWIQAHTIDPGKLLIIAEVEGRGEVIGMLNFQNGA